MTFAASAPELDLATFDRIRQIVHARSGIALKADKATLVMARLSARMRALSLANYRAYVQHLETDTTGSEMTQLLDAISTNVTYFFREPEHFDFIQGKFAEWREGGQRRFRIWSAACSTGEEPYTLGMALADQLGGLDLRILATDLSTRALTKAMRGVYTEPAVEPIPSALRVRHLRRVQGDGRETQAVGDEIKKLVLFRQLNLIQLPLPLRGPLDLILCRNVMIYFDQPTRERLIPEFFRLLKPGGYLIVSHSESLVGVRVAFRMVRPSIYQKPASAEAERA